MLLPIVVIVSLFVGGVSVSKKLESPESRAERESYHARLEAREPEAVQECLRREQAQTAALIDANADIAAFKKIPIQR